ncbi:hypothetical protein PV11_00341 [Exophiala sideris]|uniref:F-box domain-containing protein n=1 Tax=Exophiala sideris TaxID=1016849 RepID=A0A0D1ZCS7_9EURO|nr:hypothetical protein PV11_00341 [Exophiala sideris]
MSALLELPAEILVLVLRYVNINGDLACLRLCNSRLAGAISLQVHWFIKDLCSCHRISPRVLEMFIRHQKDSQASSDTSRQSILNVLGLGRFLHDMRFIAADLDVMVGPPGARTAPAHLASGNAFLLFAVISHMLNTSSTVTPWNGDVLAPTVDGEHSLSRLLPETFLHFLDNELSLEELESVIAAINLCSTKLWSTVFLFRPKDYSVLSFGSLSGASFNMEQALLTEHVIWKGPQWVARILAWCNSGGGQAAYDDRNRGNLDLTVVNDGVWRGPHQEGARIAANGLARLLWKKRQEKIEQNASACNIRLLITDMRINAAVWRGSSGDM